MKYRFIRAELKHHRLSCLCRVLDVSRSGYYHWCNRKSSARAQANVALLDEIKRIHQANLSAYGSLKTWRALNAEGIACGKHRVVH